MTKDGLPVRLENDYCLDAMRKTVELKICVD